MTSENYIDKPWKAIGIKFLLTSHFSWTTLVPSKLFQKNNFKKPWLEL